MRKRLIALGMLITMTITACGQHNVVENDPVEPVVVENEKAEVTENESEAEKQQEETERDVAEETSADTSNQTQEQDLKEPETTEEPEINNQSEIKMTTTKVKDTDNFYGIEFTKDSDIFARIKGKSYKDDCTVPVSDLRYLHVLHVGFDGQTHEGEIICNKAIAEDLLEIFEALYEAGYQIEKIKLVDEYNAEDEASMADNNSSAFNFRFISHTTKISNHGKGMAIDINPLYNPYIKTVNGNLNIEPANSTEYVDRTKDFPHKIDENDLAYQLFIAHGFSWGGAWSSSKDYQHFEK
ncbi:M15 family metallopeptidase [Pseudobutyrivibrio sp. MD2005]|uniref:M15 family metallopeptidase n=1 Tax=Pseudobutyrivibrio sp. MD2005 TaxID=1410616 RepID=UPI001FA752EB|nr:M15 family metallopeptidase [Pseudobutyrivibrio sp. MD2005]